MTETVRTAPTDAIGLSERLIESAKEALAVAKGEQPAARLHINGHAYVPATALDALQARVKELEREVEAFHRHEQTLRDNGIASHSEAVVRVVDAESRTLRAEQERDEALEHLATILRYASRNEAGPEIAAARDLVRRLASGTEKEGK